MRTISLRSLRSAQVCQNSKITAISATKSHAVFVTLSGECYALIQQNTHEPAFGVGRAEVGFGAGKTLRKIHLSPDLLVNGVSCGETHVLLTTTSGKILSCGDGSFGKLGISDPKMLSRASDVNGGEPVEADHEGGEEEEEEGSGASASASGGVFFDGFSVAREAIKQKLEFGLKNDDDDDDDLDDYYDGAYEDGNTEGWGRRLSNLTVKGLEGLRELVVPTVDKDTTTNSTELIFDDSNSVSLTHNSSSRGFTYNCADTFDGLFSNASEMKIFASAGKHNSIVVRIHSQ